jgi:hypothetical protein
MKLKIVSILFLLMTSITFGQNAISKTTFEHIQYPEALEWYNDDIYCAGYTFVTKLNDGNASDAYLVNYDKNLKPKWSLKIDEKPSNIIYAVKRHQDKIYALVTQGHVKPLERDTFLSLFIIDLNGVVLEKIPFGRSFKETSNIEIEGETLVFGHRVSEGVSYTSKSKAEIIQYNINTKKVTRHKNKHDNGLKIPREIFAKDDRILLIGSFLHRYRPNIMILKNGTLSEIHLKQSKSEYYIDSYVKNNTLTVLSVDTRLDEKRDFLKIYTVNLDDNTVTINKRSYTELGFSAVRFNSFTTEDHKTWTIVKSKDTKTLDFVLLDKNGKKLKTTQYDEKNGNGYLERYIFKEKMFLNANSSGIYIYKI